MARAVDPQAGGLVVELGPGTGPVTKALLTRGIRRDQLLLVEYDPYFCKLLGERFAPVRIVRGDAYALAATLTGKLTQPVAAVVSSLPLLNEPPERRLRLLDDAFSLMGPEGVFVQFTYGLGSPIPREACGGAYVGRRGAPILRNLPPASVWTFRRPGRQAPAPTLIDHAERLRARLVAQRLATEKLLERHSDRMKAFVREASALRPRRNEPPDEWP